MLVKCSIAFPHQVAHCLIPIDMQNPLGDNLKELADGQKSTVQKSASSPNCSVQHT